MKANNIKIFQETATRLEKRARSTERSEEYVDNEMRKLLSRYKFEYRETALDHSSRTMARDFQALDPDPLPIAKHTTSSIADSTMSTPSVTSSTSAIASSTDDPTLSTDGLTSFTSSTNATPITTTEAGEGHHVFFDPSTAVAIMLKIAGVDVGAGFKEFQCEAASIVNDMTKKLTLERLPMFMACNYILHLDLDLPGVDEDDMDRVRESLHGFQTLTFDGLMEASSVDIAFRLHNEDTQAHASLDALMSMVFPASHRNVELSWANRASIGSRDRRGDSNKPDATIVKDTSVVGFVEIKPPGEERLERVFLDGQWALDTFAKDSIDYHIRHGRGLKTIPCLQVFGFQLILYKLEFTSGLYVWQHVGAAYLPRDMNDHGTIAGSIALLHTFMSGKKDFNVTSHSNSKSTGTSQSLSALQDNPT
ncbi:hypothetical protein KI688_000706 [Linnemannia hyalina]|uniref:Uncharacterized protein n=1 Tax=Linnemannia hyalina TaxID=64524 RepID=A0A9P8BYC2_9FUNG|nr:hypothetical protein KI688_000706 [Linnemannia hyalina]